MQQSAVVNKNAVTQVPITSQADVLHARKWGRFLASAANFEPAQVTLVAAAISELARNIVLHARRGEIALQLVENGEQRGIRIVASDNGPGIADLEHAMRSSRSRTGSPGLGLRAVKRVMDQFLIESHPSHGTRVVVTKWRP